MLGKLDNFLNALFILGFAEPSMLRAGFLQLLQGALSLVVVPGLVALSSPVQHWL